MSADPLEPVTASEKVLSQVSMYPEDWNRYAYGLNNPIAHKDPNGNFTGRDHYAMEVRALTESGYSAEAAQRAANADKAMDTPFNMLSGVAVTWMFFNTSENPQHGEQENDYQGVAAANSSAWWFEENKLVDAAVDALNGNVSGALDNIGKTSHTTQDVVRHKFEPPSKHPWHEAKATQAEKDAANQKTKIILGRFEAKVRSVAAVNGLTPEQANAAIQKVKDGPK